MPQSASTALKAVLPSTNNYTEWLVGWDSPLEIAMAVWYSVSNSHYCLKLAVTLDPASTKSNKCATNGHCYLQRAVTLDWMDSIALWEHSTTFFSRAEKPSEDMYSHLFLMNKKGLSVLDPLHTRSSLRESQLKIRQKNISRMDHWAQWREYLVEIMGQKNAVLL